MSDDYDIDHLPRPKEMAERTKKEMRAERVLSSFTVGCKVGGANGYNDIEVMARARQAIRRLVSEGRLERHPHYGRGWYRWRSAALAEEDA